MACRILVKASFGPFRSGVSFARWYVLVSDRLAAYYKGFISLTCLVSERLLGHTGQGNRKPPSHSSYGTQASHNELVVSFQEEAVGHAGDGLERIAVAESSLEGADDGAGMGARA